MGNHTSTTPAVARWQPSGTRLKNWTTPTPGQSSEARALVKYYEEALEGAVTLSVADPVGEFAAKVMRESGRWGPQHGG